MTTLAGVAAASSNHIVPRLRVFSLSNDVSLSAYVRKKLNSITGIYMNDGENAGFPRYRRDMQDGLEQYLYCSSNKRLWAFTSFSAKIVANKGSVSSLVSSDSPVGVAYRVIGEGRTWASWIDVPYLMV